MPGADGRLTCGWCDQCSYLWRHASPPGCILLFSGEKWDKYRVGYLTDVLAAAANRAEAKKKRA